MHTFARWVATPENRAAFVAVQRVAECVVGERPRREISPLFLHGPPGTGKTHLVSALGNEVKRRCPEKNVLLVRGNDLLSAGMEGPLSPSTADLLVVENLQHLPAVAAETLVQIFEDCQAHERQMVFTCTVGPRLLGHLPARLTSRLACGLVVGLELFTPAGRLTFLQDRAERRHIPVERSVLTWLANHVGGSGRQLEGTMTRLEELVRLQGRLPDLAGVARSFGADADAARPTVERITERVSSYYRIERRRLLSRQRSRSALVPRQVGMYLARQLTGLSLGEIGTYFGGRDHTTVLHACRKIDHALAQDATLSGAVRHLQAELA